MGISNVTHLADKLNTDQPGSTNPNGVALVAGFTLMHQDAGLQNIMVQPFTVISLDYGREHLLEMRGTDVGNPVDHRVFWIITHNKTSLYIASNLDFNLLKQITFEPKDHWA